MNSNSSKREKVGLSTEPACLRKINHKESIGKPIKVKVPIIRGEATSDVRLCPSQSVNRQKLYAKGDTVMIIKDYQKCEGPVWVIVEHKKGNFKLYRRHINDVDGTLSDVKNEEVQGMIKSKGYVGDNAKVGHNIVTQKECYLVDFDDMDIEGIWFEKNMFKDNIEANGERVMNLDSDLCVSAFKAGKRVSTKFMDPESHMDDMIIASFKPLCPDDNSFNE